MPHQLVPWLLLQGVWPAGDCVMKSVEQFWTHAELVKATWRSAAPSNKHHPLYIWGDDCTFNEQGEKLLVVAMGHCCDKDASSLDCIWPLAVLRCELQSNFSRTVHDSYDYGLFRFGHLARGPPVAAEIRSSPLDTRR